MRGASGRWLVVAALTLAMLLYLSGVAGATWSATASGPERAVAIAMPDGQPPTAIRIDKKIMTVLIPRPVLFGTTRIAAFIVYRMKNSQEPELVILTGCTSLVTTLKCSDLTVNHGGSYTYAVAPSYGMNWVGALSPSSNLA